MSLLFDITSIEEEEEEKKHKEGLKIFRGGEGVEILKI